MKLNLGPEVFLWLVYHGYLEGALHAALDRKELKLIKYCLQ
jgi:hypothetical protein